MERAMTRRWICGALGCVDLGVSVHALHGVLAGVAVAAEDAGSPARSPRRRPRRPSAWTSSPRRLEGHPVRPIQAARQTSSRAASISIFMSASVKAIDWLSMIARPNVSALFRVVERVLVGGAGDADGLGADRRPARPRRSASPPGSALLPRGLGRAVRRASPCRRAGRNRGSSVIKIDVRGVRGAQAVLLDLGAQLQPGARRNHEGGVAAGLELAIDLGETTWTLAIPPFVAQAFGR